MNAARGAAIACGLAAAVALGAAARPAAARTLPAPVDGAALSALLVNASAGDTVRLGSAIYRGNFTSNVPLVILGAGTEATVLDARGHGTVLTLKGGACVVTDLTIQDSGSSLLEDEAGLHLIGAPASLVTRVRFDRNLHGIYLERAGGTTLTDLAFHGLKGRVSEANNGNAVHLWYSPGVTLQGVDVTGHRDGAYVSFCKNVAIYDSRFHDNDRYGLHYMYSDSNRIERCTFERNVAGAAIMFSNGLLVRHNAFRDNSDARAYGLLLRDCSHGVFEDNDFTGNTVGIFLDNAMDNRVYGNRIEGNGWGLSLFASSTGNRFEHNDLVDNLFPIAVDTRRNPNLFRGNYWSAVPGYDLDGDRRGDVPVRPVALFAFLSKRYPDLAIFADSPAIAALSAAERTLPALGPSEVSDSLPALAPWTRPAHGSAEDAPRGSWPLALGSGLAVLSGGGALWRTRRS